MESELLLSVHYDTNKSSARNLLRMNSFTATGDYKRLLQTADIQMRRLVMSRVIWIYTV